MTRRRSLLVDTDTATDDALALLLAAASDRATIELVTTVAGNVPVDQATANAAYALDLIGSDPPIAQGATRPLLRPLETAEEVHGVGGLGGRLVPEYPETIDDRAAPAAIIEAAHDHPSELTLVCLGPLTNLARALARDPSIANRFESIWIMGGAAHTHGNVTPVAEYNFYVDPDAAARVLDSVDATLVEWGLSRRVGTLTDDVIEQITAESADSRTAAFFETVIPAVRAFSEVAETDGGVVLADVLAMALVLEPALWDDVETYHVSIDPRDGPTRGLSIVGEADRHGGHARTQVIESANRTGFNRMLHDALLGDDPHARIGDQ